MPHHNCLLRIASHSASHQFSIHKMEWTRVRDELAGEAVRRHDIGRGNIRIGLPGGGYVTIAVPNRVSLERRAKVEARSSSICKMSGQLHGMKAIAHSAGQVRHMHVDARHRCPCHKGSRRLSDRSYRVEAVITLNPKLPSEVAHD